MALYRFLFAPVLLAVAVVVGTDHAPESAPPAPAPHVQAAAVAPDAALIPRNVRDATRGDAPRPGKKH
jgi:hypothetical protein